MRVLVLGGSWLVGAHLVSALVDSGYAVTVFNRGLTSVDRRRSVRTIHGDWGNADDIAALTRAGPWETVLDVAGSVPRVVRDYTRSLRPAAGRPVRFHLDDLGLPRLAVCPDRRGLGVVGRRS